MIAAKQRKKTGFGRIIFLALAGLMLLGPGAAPAQVLPDLSSQAPAEASTEDMKALLKTLEDPAERDKLAAQLRALIAAREHEEPGKGERLFTALSDSVESATDHIAEASQALANVPAVADWVQRQLTDPAARGAVFALAVKLLIVIGLAGFIAFGSVRLFAPLRARAERTAAQGGLLRWLMRLVYALLDFAPVVMFAAVAYIVLPFTGPDAATRAVAIAIVNAVVLLRAVMVATGLILVPDASVLRLVPVGSETAHYLYIWVRRIAATAICGYFAAQAALVLGLHEGGYHAVLNALALIIVVMLVILILQSRRNVAGWIRGRSLEPLTKTKPGTLAGLRSFLGDIWHVLVILYLVALYFVYALRVPGGFEFVLTAGVLTIVIILVAELIYALLSRTMDSGFAINDDLRRRFPTIEKRANRYLPVFDVAAKIVIFGAAILLLLQVWGLDSISWFTSGIGQEVTLTAAGIIVVLAVAAAVWEAGTIYMESYLSRSETEFESAEQRARMQTLLPLFRKIFLMILVAIVSLIVLAQLGLNIAPLLAGAGIIGLAIGFGAQKVVQDVFNGLFIFLEAAVAIGDWVEMGGHSGMVEAMSIRSIRLRDLAGNVHTLPFSAVTSVMNRTKGYSYHLFDIGVAYGETVDNVIKVLKDVGAEMRQDKKFGPDIIEDLDMLGLDKFGDSAVVIRGRIKVRPGAQWRVGREFNRRVKNRFDELGIEIPFPQRTLHFRMPPRELLEAEPGDADARDGDRS